jgi:hypothetical protein
MRTRLLWTLPLFLFVLAGCAGSPQLDATLRLFEAGEVTDTFEISCALEQAAVVRYLRPGDLSPFAEGDEPWLETLVDSDDCVGFPAELPHMVLFAEAQRSGVPHLELWPADDVTAGDDDDSTSPPDELSEELSVIVQAGEVLSMGQREGTSFTMRVQEARSEEADLSPCTCDSVQLLDANWSGRILEEIDRDGP